MFAGLILLVILTATLCAPPADDRGKKPIDDKGKQPMDPEDSDEEWEDAPDEPLDLTTELYADEVPWAFDASQACRRLHTDDIFDPTQPPERQTDEWDLEFMTKQKALWVYYM